MSTDYVLLLRWGALFYIDKVCATFPFTYQHNTGRYRNALLFKQNARRYQRALPFKQNAKKIFDTFTIKQNAEKVSETKREGRRYAEAFSMKYMMPYTRSEATSRPSRWSIWCLICVLNEFGLTVLQYSPQSPPASHCLYRFRWA